MFNITPNLGTRVVNAFNCEKNNARASEIIFDVSEEDEHFLSFFSEVWSEQVCLCTEDTYFSSAKTKGVNTARPSEGSEDSWILNPSEKNSYIPDNIQQLLSFSSAVESEFLRRNINSAVHTNLGNIKGAQRDLKSAITHYRQAKELNPLNEAAWTNLALACYKCNNFEASNEEAYLRLARKCVEKGIPDAGIDLYKAALLCNPSGRRTFFELAKLYELLGRADDAKQNFQNAYLLDSFLISKTSVVP